MILACLHTAESNVAIFDEALAALPVGAIRLRHLVRADLLREADAPTLAEAARALSVLGRGVDAVLLTCSTLGEAAALATAPCPVLRADAALAEAATRGGGVVHVLYAAPSSEEPTRAIFAAAALRNKAEYYLHACPGAWDAFLAHDLSRYHAMVAAVASGLTGRVALAQSSMAGARALITPRPLTVAPAALMAAIRAALAARKTA